MPNSKNLSHLLSMMIFPVEVPNGANACTVEKQIRLITWRLQWVLE